MDSCEVVLVATGRPVLVPKLRLDLVNRRSDRDLLPSASLIEVDLSILRLVSSSSLFVLTDVILKLNGIP